MTEVDTSPDSMDDLGSAYDALSSHVILVIDSGPEESSLLVEAIRRHRTSRYSQRHLYFDAGGGDTSSIARLREWLQMADPAPSGLHYEEMLRLRSVIVDWDRVPNAIAYCEEVRLAYPCLALFAVFSADEAEIIADFRNARLGDAPVVYSGPGRYVATTRELGADLSRAIDLRYEAPYWDSLRWYSKHPIISFHALPLGQSRSLSQSLTDFAAFYGKQHFAAETSLSTSPLDSLLTPRSTIKLAQSKAAYAFGVSIGLDDDAAGSFGTRFSTNGTSTANAVVISAFVRPGDYVLMEQTAHISHFNALAAVHAKPVLLRPLLNRCGGIGPIPLEVFKEGLRDVIRRRNTLPAAVILTNPTFDGLFYKPLRVVEAIREVLENHWQQGRNAPGFDSLLASLHRRTDGEPAAPDASAITLEAFVALGFRSMVLLFDEAWSAKSYFHPRLIEYSAMRSAWDLSRKPDFDYANKLRIYATQSTHKSLSALRQGSMIHYRDPEMKRPEVNQVFEHAYRAHCTTSPSATIIASLDVARRQAQLEGALLIERCLRLAENFRERFAADRPKRAGTGFYTLSDEMMMLNAGADQPDLSREESFLDPTHITLSWDFGATGADVRDALLENSIQVNKYTDNTVLAIFNIGIDESSVSTLEEVLTRLGTELADRAGGQIAPDRPPALPPLCTRIHQDRDMGYWLQNQGNHTRELKDIQELLQNQREGPPSNIIFLSAGFVTPYPPGFPVLCPGQEVTAEILEFLLTVNTREIFGTCPTATGKSIMVLLIDS
jgi:arginine decarboxylase